MLKKSVCATLSLLTITTFSFLVSQEKCWDLRILFSVFFEFICRLTETPKCKKTVKKFLDELVHFLVLYMQITEEQVGFVFHFYFQPIISSLFCTHIPNNRWLLDTCHIDQTITFFAVICLLQGKCGHPIQINLLKMRMMTPFLFAVEDVLLVSEWNSFNIQFTPSVLVCTPFSYGAHLLCYNWLIVCNLPVHYTRLHLISIHPLVCFKRVN